MTTTVPDLAGAPAGATHLECAYTGERVGSEELQGLSPSGFPLVARDPLHALRGAPMARAFEEGADRATFWQGASTYASGLRVSGGVGDFLILLALRESGGGAVTIPDRVMADRVRRVGASTGVSAAPEGGAVAAAVEVLRGRAEIREEDEVVLFNTGSGLKYVGMEPEEG